MIKCPAKQIKIECPICKNIFNDYLSNKRKFCSWHCYKIFCKGRIPVNIRQLQVFNTGRKKKYKDKKSWLRSLSLCKIGKMAGKKHWNWRGGITPKATLIRNSLNYENWRKEVFERDNFTCQECGIHSGNGKAVYLEAHHIKSFSKYPELRLDVNNGKTLCLNCHCEIDKHRSYLTGRQ